MKGLRSPKPDVSQYRERMEALNKRVHDQSSIGFNAPGALGQSPWTPQEATSSPQMGFGMENGTGFAAAAISKVGRTVEADLQQKLEETEAKLEDAEMRIEATEEAAKKEVVD